MSPEQNSLRVLLVGPSLEPTGGAEKQFRTICTHLFGGNLDICVLLGDAATLTGFRQKNIIHLNWRGERSYPRIAIALRNVIRRGGYHVVFSYGLFQNLVAWLATRFDRQRPKLIFCENSRPWCTLAERSRSSWMKAEGLRGLCRLAYPQADLCTANSIDGVEECIRYFKVQKHRSARLPNVFDDEELRSLASERLEISWPSDGAVITTAARLDPMKRIDTLINAVASLPKELNWYLVILGDGAERERLRRRAGELRLKDRVIFSGWITNICPAIRRSTAHVLTSTYEGFSNSVLEAMFLDVPVITSFCSSDARKMVQAGATLGFEVGDTAALSRHLAHVLTSERTRQELVRRGREYSFPYSISKAIPAQEEIIIRTVFGSYDGEMREPSVTGETRPVGPSSDRAGTADNLRAT